MQVLALKHSYNTRDLGGTVINEQQMVADRKLIRSANLVGLDKADNQFLYDYGVRTVIDLRAKDEVAEHADQILLPGIKCYNVPIFQDGSTDAAHHANGSRRTGFQKMMTEYHELVESTFSQKAYRQIFDLLLTKPVADHGVLFHCWGGKDRTGIIAYLLLGLLGVPEAAIEADYQYTNVLSQPITDEAVAAAQGRQASAAELADIDAFMSAKTDYYQEMDERIKAHGGVLKYLQEQIGLSTTEIATLQTNYRQERV